MNRDLQRLSLAAMPLAWVALQAFAAPSADRLPQSAGLAGLLTEAIADVMAARAGVAYAVDDTDGLQADDTADDDCRGGGSQAIPAACLRAQLQAEVSAGHDAGAGP